MGDGRIVQAQQLDQLVRGGVAGRADSTMQSGLSRAASQAACALAGVPSTSIDWCWTGRP